MNGEVEENGVQYVVSLPAEDKRLNFKRVSLKELPPSVAQIIKCKELKTLTSAVKLSSPQVSKNIENDNGLKAVTEPVSQMKNDHNSNNKFTLEPIPKRIRTEMAMRFHKKATKDERNGNTIVSVGKASRESRTDEELDEDETDEFDSLEESFHLSNKRSLSNDKKRNASKEDLYYSHDSYRKKGKPKLFRPEWLDIDIFKDWLDRDPTNPSKARCLACNTTMNAGKSELEKHATGAKHCQNVELMQEQEMIFYQAEGEEEVGDMMANVETSLNEGDQVIGNAFQDHHREQELEAINRLTASVDNLSSNMTLFFEKLCSNQDTLIQILQQLVPK